MRILAGFRFIEIGVNSNREPLKPSLSLSYLLLRVVSFAAMVFRSLQVRFFLKADVELDANIFLAGRRRVAKRDSWSREAGRGGEGGIKYQLRQTLKMSLLLVAW